jgi:hypothetical protein
MCSQPSVKHSRDTTDGDMVVNKRGRRSGNVSMWRPFVIFSVCFQAYSTIDVYIDVMASRGKISLDVE